ncbi:MAG: PqiC family protein [Desulfobacterales bacterium]|jgi:hypothetical protein
MMRDKFFQKTSRFILTAAVLLVGCGSSPPPVEFYTLNSLSGTMQQASPAVANQNIGIGIGPVEIPKMLDRPQIVTRTGPNKLRMDEFHRWAGPLKDGFARVLAENIGLLLATDRVAIYPWEIDFKPNYRIAVDIRYFEGQLGENVILEAIWRVSGQEGQEIQIVKTSVIKETLSSPDYEALVAAKSQTIAQLSREIVQEIQRLQAK